MLPYIYIYIYIYISLPLKISLYLSISLYVSLYLSMSLCVSLYLFLSGRARDDCGNADLLSRACRSNEKSHNWLEDLIFVGVLYLSCCPPQPDQKFWCNLPGLGFPSPFVQKIPFSLF